MSVFTYVHLPNCSCVYLSIWHCQKFEHILSFNNIYVKQVLKRNKWNLLHFLINEIELKVSHLEICFVSIVSFFVPISLSTWFPLFGGKRRKMCRESAKSGWSIDAQVLTALKAIFFAEKNSFSSLSNSISRSENHFANKGVFSDEMYNLKLNCHIPFTQDFSVLGSEAVFLVMLGTSSFPARNELFSCFLMYLCFQCPMFPCLPVTR